MHSPFEYNSYPYRVLFGLGTRDRVAEEVEGLGCSRALILSTKGQAGTAEEIASILGERTVGLFDNAQPHVPMNIVRQAQEEAGNRRADCLISVGGGSTTGLAKAVALKTGLPIVAIPTTYAGSEMTPVYGITEDGKKTTGKDHSVLPASVIYDVELSKTLPYSMAVTSGMNAIAHAAEGLYAQDSNPLMALLAEEGIRASARGLRTLRRDEHDIEGRKDCAYGAWICGMVLASVGMALHHKLCHTLGGTFDLPHAETHTVVLPHAIAFNVVAAEHAGRIINRALGSNESENAGSALYDLAVELNAPIRLGEYGFQHRDIDKAAKQTLDKPYANPREVTEAVLRTLLEDAIEGRRPTS